MKFAIVGPVYPFRGGIAHFSGCLYQELERQENQTLLINFRQQYPALFFPGKCQIETDSYFCDIPSSRILTPYNPFTYAKAIRIILDFCPDVVIFNLFLPYFIPAYSYLIKKLKKSGIKIMIIAHNIDFHEHWVLGKTLTRKILRQADYIMSLSEAVYRDAKELVGQSNVKHIKGFHPLYSFHDQNRYTANTAREKLGLQNKKVILFFGYIKPYKGVDLLIKSFAHLKEKMDDAVLLIAGEIYGNRQRYLDLISLTGYEEDIILCDDYISSDDVELYFKAADVLVLPYRQATQSGVIQTAYVMGLGIVVTPVGGLPEMVIAERTGVIANSVSENDLALAIEHYFTLNREIIRKSIGRYREDFSWSRFVKLLVEAV